MESLYKSIFFVDDDQEDHILFNFALSSSFGDDLKVQSVTSAQEAIQRLSEGFSPDMLFLDLNMPRIDGKEFLRINADKGFYKGPIVVLTTSSSPGDAAECKELGAKAFCSKPFGLSSLQNLFQRVLTTDNLEGLSSC